MRRKSPRLDAPFADLIGIKGDGSAKGGLEPFERIGQALYRDIVVVAETDANRQSRIRAGGIETGCRNDMAEPLTTAPPVINDKGSARPQISSRQMTTGLRCRGNAMRVRRRTALRTAPTITSPLPHKNKPACDPALPYPFPSMATRRDNNGSTAHHILSDVKRLERRSGGPATDKHNSMVVPPLSRQPSVTPDSQFAGPPTERQREPNTAEDVRRITTAWRGEKNAAIRARQSRTPEDTAPLGTARPETILNATNICYRRQ